MLAGWLAMGLMAKKTDGREESPGRPYTLSSTLITLPTPTGN